MKAVTYEKFGPPEVLQITEEPAPVAKEKEVLIQIHATAVNAAECNLRGLSYIPPGLEMVARLMLGIRKPKNRILGSALSGEIVTVGSAVEEFRIGDQVFGTTMQSGAYAEFAATPAAGALALKPGNMSHEQAATIPYGALTALYFLKDKAGIRLGRKVLVHGASGNVGMFAVQLAHCFGAEVTGVCSTANIELVRSLGADHVIDRTKEDFTTKNERWDIIIDPVVGKTSFARCRKSLNPGGFYLAVAGGLKEAVQMLLTARSSRKVVFGGGGDCERKDNLILLKELIEAGKLTTVVDRSFPLDQIVEAHRYFESGARKGNVSVVVS